MKERIKQIRKESKLTQQKFADKLNVSKSTIEAVEYGRREITDRMLLDICREFDISEQWLRTGEGEMHPPKTRNAEIADAVMKIYDAKDPFRDTLIQLLSDLPDDDWYKVQDFVHELVRITDGKKEPK